MRSLIDSRRRGGRPSSAALNSFFSLRVSAWSAYAGVPSSLLHSSSSHGGIGATRSSSGRVTSSENEESAWGSGVSAAAAGRTSRRTASRKGAMNRVYVS